MDIVVNSIDIILAWLHPSPEDFMIRMEILNVLASLVLLLTYVYPLPYGRYSGYFRLTGWTVGGKTVWRGFSVSWLIPILLIFLTPSRMLGNFNNLVAFSLFLAHYIYRSVFYPKLCLKNCSDWPIEMGLVAIGACAFNSFVQAYHILNVYQIRSPGITGAIGLTMYAVGLYINITHDKLLADLRNKKTGGKGKGKYEVPRGGLFEYVSAANYFGEIVEWWGLALFTGGLPQIMFGITTTITIGIRGWQHHKFYKKTFGKTYPSNRKAIVPFLL